MAEKVSVDVTASDNTDTPTVAPCRSELLCFLQQKAKTLAFDHLVKLCADFYRKDEIIAARSLVEQAVSKRLTRK